MLLKYCLIFKEIFDLWSYLNVTQLSEKQNLYFNETNWKIPSNNPDIPDLTSLKDHIYYFSQPKHDVQASTNLTTGNKTFFYKMSLWYILGDFQLQASLRVHSVLCLILPQVAALQVRRGFSMFIVHLARPKVNTKNAISRCYLGFPSSG